MKLNPHLNFNGERTDSRQLNSDKADSLFALRYECE